MSAFTSFPAPDYWAVLLLLPAAMFVYSSRGKWVFPPLLWSFPPSATLTKFPAPGCWAHAPAPVREVKEKGKTSTQTRRRKQNKVSDKKVSKV
jgi:hypothetical protein